MNPILYNDIVTVLLKTIPELDSEFRRQPSELQSLPHIICGSLWTDLIRQCYAGREGVAGKQHRDILYRSFQFMEAMAQSPDGQTQNVVEVSVLESLLGDDDDDWNRFSALFGPRTKEMGIEFMKQWGHADRLGRQDRSR